MSKPVCKIVGLDEFGPLLEWSEHWSKFPVGTALAAYAAQQSAPCEQPAARVALTRSQIDKIMTKHYPLDSLLRENVDAFEACVRDIEAEFCRVNGITAPAAQETQP